MTSIAAPAVDQTERARAAVVVAVQSLQSLKNEFTRVVPESSRGRREVVAQIDAALAATGMAIQGIGDDQPSLWRRALDLGQRAVERAGQFIREVGRIAVEPLRRLWNVTVEVARAAKEAVAGAVTRAYEAAKTAVAAAAAVLVGLVSASAGVMFSGWVAIAFIAVLYFSMKD